MKKGRLKKNVIIMLFVGNKFIKIFFLVFIMSSFISNAKSEMMPKHTPPLKKHHIYFVSHQGSDNNTGQTVKYALKSIQKAIEKALPGDEIIILPGKYYEKLHTVRDGTKYAPIKITGTINTVIYGNRKPGGKIFQINHNHIIVSNLIIDGHFIDFDIKGAFHDKILYIKGEIGQPIRGIKVLSSVLQNAWGECLRIRLAKDIEINGNRILNCGLRDFRFKRGKQNGEGIYIGTAPEQMPDNKLDNTEHIRIRNNVIATFGAECIDVKEGTENVLIDSNICFEEKAEKVGGISIRGNNNTVTNNIIFKNKGAGIRLGGDNKSFGINNIIRKNYLDNNKFALKIMNLPQLEICGNIATNENGKKVYPDKNKKEGYFLECK